MVVSFALALGLNMLLAVLLMFTSQSKVKKPPPGIIATIGQSDSNRQDNPLSKVNMTAAAASMASSSAALQSSDQSLQVLSSMSLSDTVIQSSIGLGGDYGKGFSSGTENSFGRSDGLMGSGYRGLIDALGKSGKGDGSSLIVICDHSGSMKKHSEKVERLLFQNYQKARVYSSKGCAFEIHSSFIDALARAVKRAELQRRNIIFVCDLQDSVSSEGTNRLIELLFLKEPHFVFNVISFQKFPKKDLMLAIEASGGTFSFAGKK